MSTHQKTVRNATALGLLVNDVILQPQWARGVVNQVISYNQERSGEPAVRVKRANEEDIIFWPGYVLTIDRRTVVPQLPVLPPLETP